MAPEIALDRQRPAEYVFSRHVEDAMARLRRQANAGKLSPANGTRQLAPGRGRG